MCQLIHATENPGVKAIWLDQNSPGGVVDGAFDLAQAIYANNEKNGGKPIWAMAADYSASCSYLMSSAADPLDSAGDRGRRFDLDHQVDGAHVDAELE